MASQVTLASIPSKAVHNLIQQLDRTTVEANRQTLLDSVNSQPECSAALLLENLGIDQWFQLQVTFSVNGEEAVKALILKYHNDLPTLLELDQMEEIRAEKHAGMIGTVLNWVDLNRNSTPVGDGTLGEKTNVDVLSQVRANPLINFSVFSSEEQAVYNESLDLLNVSFANELAARTDEGELYIPTDNARMIEYKVSEKNAMMWKIPNMNNLAPMTLEMWQKLIHASDTEQRDCLHNALNGVTPSKMLTMKDTVKMACFRDKYRCRVTVKTKQTVPCKGEMLWFDHAIWYMYNHLGDFFPQLTIQGRYMAFLIFLGGEARPAVLAHLTFLHARKLMIDTAMEVFANPKVRTLPEHGDAYGVRLIERMIKPACFSDEIISKEIQSGNRKRTRPVGIPNLNGAPTPMVPRGRGQRFRGGRHYQGNRPSYQSPGSSSSNSRASNISGVSHGQRNLSPFQYSLVNRRNMASEFQRNN
ncbi:hypothetical protein R1flu_011123 [Riccia fluitans]|uniref:Uncharacterized protein n=1 Tax=Riccia fluitans TaxID=41844 RepID=A0ABD1Z6X8_9MARC